jgi:hypothetical protein
MATDVRCDICEMPTRPVWVFRSDFFQLLCEGEAPLVFTQDSEWGACADCKTDVLEDNQMPILDRRRAAATEHYANEGLTPDQMEGVQTLLALIVMAFLSCRQKNYGRPFNVQDAANAIVSVAMDGRGAPES